LEEASGITGSLSLVGARDGVLTIAAADDVPSVTGRRETRGPAYESSGAQASRRDERAAHSGAVRTGHVPRASARLKCPAALV